MLLASRLVDATRAYGVGALVACVEDSEALDAELAALVDGISHASRVTLTVTKDQLHRRALATEASPADEEAVLAEVYNGADFKEGVRAFLAKERPAFVRDR
jgi:enoyl-CoA hydratase/carnithine racemase